MGIRQSIIGMLITAVTLGGTLLAAHNTEPVHRASAAHSAHLAHLAHLRHLSHHAGRITVRTYGDCEDYGLTNGPCVTYDEGSDGRLGWQLVTSYTPYRSTTLATCADTAGLFSLRTLPCVWDSRAAGTRRYVVYRTKVSTKI